MNLNKEMLEKAKIDGIINDDQFNNLYLIFEKNKKSSLNLTNIFYYSGGLLAIIAMMVLFGISFEKFNFIGIFILSTLYFFIGILTSRYFEKKEYFIPASISILFSISVIPLFIFSLQNILINPNVIEITTNYLFNKNSNLFLPQIGSLIASICLFYRFKYSLIILPISIFIGFSLYEIFMFFFPYDIFNYDLKKYIAVFVGLILISLGIIVDLKNNRIKDYSLWFYTTGILSFWIGFGLLNYHNDDLKQFLFFSINLFMIVFGTIFLRKIFIILGLIGCIYYIFYLTSQFGLNNMLLVLFLTLSGSFFILIGIFWKKNNQKIIKNMINLFSGNIKDFLLQLHRN